MMKTEKVKVSSVDLRIALAAAICVLSSWFSPFCLGQPVIQSMTACISVLLCAQETADESRKAGITRLMVTLIGGAAAVIMIALDEALQNRGIKLLLIIAGLLLTLYGCKCFRLPYINAKIGGVTFILVMLTKTGTDRVIYAGFRAASTIYGAAVILLVTWIWQKISDREK